METYGYIVCFCPQVPVSSVSICLCNTVDYFLLCFRRLLHVVFLLVLVFAIELIISFSVSDTCYVLSFAIIMLNTSLHNPSVKEKPSVERFINMNRGINDGGNLPDELLIVSRQDNSSRVIWRNTGICYVVRMPAISNFALHITEGWNYLFQ